MYGFCAAARRCGRRGSLGRCPAREPKGILTRVDAQVADILVASLTVDMTPIPRKMARLYVVSDILHNSSASLPTAWKYRQTLEKALPPVFDHLNVIYRSFPGRLKAEGFRKQVGAVLAVWDAFMVFPQTTLADLSERLAANDETEGTGGASTGASD